MRAFVTEATGFIGGHVARRLRERGDEVVALVRSPDRATALRDLGCELVEGDLSSVDAIRRGAEGCDAALHIAAVYKVGIPKSERESMHDANVRGTERVLDAAVAAGAGRIVYVSTGNVFGNTRDTVADEGYERDPADGFMSVYDETKFRAHQAARKRIAAGAPVVIAQPGAVYGPGDTSQVGNMIDQVRSGRLKLVMFPEFTLQYAHVDDIAAGIVLVLDKGRVGESYVLGGEEASMRELVTYVAELSGRTPPKRVMPTALIKSGIPFGPVVGRLMGFPPNLAELVRTSDGVTFWASDDKARRELGYSPRPLDTGLRETIATL